MSEQRRREIHGYIRPSGARIFLGYAVMEDKRVRDLLKEIGDAYANPDARAALEVAEMALDLQSFAGISITPAPEDTP